MGNTDRFVLVYSQGAGIDQNTMKIFVDRETGVNYLWSGVGQKGGLTVLLNADGTPVVTPLPKHSGK